MQEADATQKLEYVRAQCDSRAQYATSRCTLCALEEVSQALTAGIYAWAHWGEFEQNEDAQKALASVQAALLHLRGSTLSASGVFASDAHWRELVWECERAYARISALACAFAHC
jgi:hypothetical protein